MASSDLVNMGIGVVSYTLKDVHDDQVFPELLPSGTNKLKLPLRRFFFFSQELLASCDGGGVILTYCLWLYRLHTDLCINWI